MIFSIEINAIAGNYFDSNDGWVVMISLLAFVQTFTYSQLDTLLSYVACLAYTFPRTYYWITDPSRWLRFNLYLLMTFIIMCIFSRAFHQRERDHFVKMKNQKQLLMLFSNLIKVYHDGIVISTSEDVILYNKQMTKIFGTGPCLNEEVEDGGNGVQDITE